MRGRRDFTADRAGDLEAFTHRVIGRLGFLATSKLLPSTHLPDSANMGANMLVAHALNSISRLVPHLWLSSNVTSSALFLLCSPSCLLPFVLMLRHSVLSLPAEAVMSWSS